MALSDWPLLESEEENTGGVRGGLGGAFDPLNEGVCMSSSSEFAFSLEEVPNAFDALRSWRRLASSAGSSVRNLDLWATVRGSVCGVTSKFSTWSCASSRLLDDCLFSSEQRTGHIGFSRSIQDKRTIGATPARAIVGVSTVGHGDFMLLKDVTSPHAFRIYSRISPPTEGASEAGFFSLWPAVCSAVF